MRALVFIAISVALTAWLPWRPEREGPPSSWPALASALPCRPPHAAKRTFVGFRDHRRWMTDFEVAALEATRILHATRAQACGLSAQQDARGRLQAALSQRPMEISAVYFEGNGFTAADVHLRRGSETAATDAPARAEPIWLLKMVRDDQGWQVVSSSRSHAPLPAR